MSPDWSLPYPSRRTPLFARQVVATSQPLAAQAGLAAMARGGNAVDAALATAITLTVVEPCSNGLGSDAFALIWDDAGLHALNGSGRSPKAWQPARFRGHEAITIGYDSVTVPGAVATWSELSRRFGRLPFADLFEPAIRYANDGFALGPTVADAWHRGADCYRDFAEFNRVFLDHGAAPATGELFRNPEQGASLARIAEEGADVFYRGELAERMAKHIQDHGGALTVADLADHVCEWVEPLVLEYRGHTLHEMPPNSQGIAVLIALGILAHCGVDECAPDSVDSVHLQIEAMKLAFDVLRAEVADPAWMTTDTHALLSDDRLRLLAAKIDRRRARLTAPAAADGGTVYLSCADADGMMVSFIQSSFWGFGSGVVVPGTGISLQNRAAGFVLEPGHPNCVAGAKRPLHTIIPGFVSRAGQPLLSFGVMGGHMQAQGHVQMLTRILDYGQNPQAAADAPRWFVDVDGSLVIEEAAPRAWAESLMARGHRLSTQAPRFAFGGAQLVLRLDNGVYCAASDPRKDGQAVGL